jgi:coenzyme F420 hydrogenase subunit delta
MDLLPTYCQARLLILGVGNLLFGDDGFGPAVIEQLQNHYPIPPDVYTMDVGTGVRKILFTLTLSELLPEEIIIADAVDWGQEVGKVFEIKAQSLPLSKIDDFSMHQAPGSNLLRELQERRKVRVTIIACDVGYVPKEIKPGLSPVVAEASLKAAQIIAQRITLS